MSHKNKVILKPLPPLWKRVLFKPYNWTKRTLKNYFRSIANVNDRIEPSFLIIGTQKGGTSSLYYYLCQHPNIAETEQKEVHFFDTNYHRGINWYHSFFPKKRNKIDISGEATPSYLVFDDIPARVKNYNPNMKLIVLLRDPVKRAISHYKMEKFIKMEKENFEVALKEEDIRIIKSRQHKFNFGYREQGLYAKYLKTWLEYFPKEQLLVLKSELFFENPKNVTNQVFDFLGLKEVEGINWKPQNESKIQESIALDTLEQLNYFFEKPNKELEDLFGIKFS